MCIVNSVKTRVCYSSVKSFSFNFPCVLIIHTVTLTTHVARVNTTMTELHVVKVQLIILYHHEICFAQQTISPPLFHTHTASIWNKCIDSSCNSHIKYNPMIVLSVLNDQHPSCYI